MKKTVLRYGLYGALTICILFIGSWFFMDDVNFELGEVIGYASMIVSLSFVYFGIKKYRDSDNNGKISFKKALTIGALISLITALAFAILDVFYVEVMNPEFMDQYYSYTIEQMRETLPADEFETKLKEMEAQKEMFSNPIFTFLIMGMTVFVIGFIISLISSLILQRK